MPNLHIIEMESADTAVPHKVIITLLDGTRVSISASAADYSGILTLLRATIRLISVASPKRSDALSELESGAPLKNGTSLTERQKIQDAAKKILSRNPRL